MEATELKPTLLRLDLQTFSDDGFEGDGFEGGVAEGGNEPEVVRGFYNPDEEIEYPSGENPLWTSNEEQGDEQFDKQFEGEQLEQDPQIEEQQFQQPQADPNQEHVQRLIQENQQMQQQMRQMLFLQQQQQQFQQPQQQQQQQISQEPELTPEEQNERLMEKFYENPSDFFNELKQQAIQEARQDFEPIIAERRIESEVQGLSQKYGQEFLSTVPQMQQLVTELGDQETERLGLERVYLMARGMQSQQQPQYQEPQYTPEQIFQDQSFINDYIAQNPAVQQAVINQYMANKQQSAPPRVMGSQFGASPSLAPEARPKSIGEASKLLRKSWGL